MHLLLVILRWVIAVPTFLVFALCLVGNWGLLAASAVEAAGGGQSRRFSFVLPVFGPLLGVISLLVAPLPGVARWWWLPVAADPLALVLVWLVVASVLKRVGGLAGRQLSAAVKRPGTTVPVTRKRRRGRAGR